MRNNYPETLCTKCGGESSSRPTLKKIKIERISGSTVSSFMQFAFIICPIPRLTKKYWNQGVSHLVLCHIKKTIKRGLELVSLPHFPHDFWGQIFLTLYSNITIIVWVSNIIKPTIIVWVFLVFGISGNMFILIAHVSVYDYINFEIYKQKIKE